MATTFFTLPRELRIMVYDFAWKNIPLVQHCNNKYNWFAWYDIDSPMISSISVKHLLTQDDAQKFVYKLPFWLLASKQVLMEGVDMFHSNGKMSLQVEKNMDPTDFALPSVLSPLETRELHIFPAVHTIAGRNRFVEVFSDSHIESLMHGLSPKRRRISESSYSTSVSEISCRASLFTTRRFLSQKHCC